MRFIALAWLCAAFALGPLGAQAAGFSSQSLFLSKSTVTEGETVLIHAVVKNDAGVAFTGTLTLTEGDTRIGSVPVSLAAGEAQTASVSWRPSAGTHPVTAELTSPDGSLIAKETASFGVRKKPAPEGAAATPGEVEPSTQLQASIANISPQVGAVATPTFTFIDSARESVAGVIDEQLVQTKGRLDTPKKGTVAGASTEAEEEPSQGLSGGFWSIVWTLYVYLLTLLRFIIGSAGVFYPVLGVLFLWTLWRVYKRMTRPA